jgi:hypothetical protein
VKQQKWGRRWAVAVCLLLTVLMMSADAGANPGNFWYGLYNVDWNGVWWDSVFAVMAHRYKMNWALTVANTGLNGTRKLDSAAANGIHIMQYGTREDGQPEDSALIWWKYGLSSYLTLEADYDTILYQWDAFYNDNCGHWEGTFARHTAPRDSSGQVSDPQASGGKAWLFHPYPNGTPDSLRVVFAGDVTDDTTGRGIFSFPVKLRAASNACQDSLVTLRLFVNTNDTSYCGSPPVYLTLAETTLTCSDLADGNYHTVGLRYGLQYNWWLQLEISTTGKARVWVDWVGVYDDHGYALHQGGQSDQEITSYINRYSFQGRGNSPVIGFWIREERWQDAKIWPRSRVTALVRQATGNLTAFTENNTLYWWQHRSRYGGSAAADARIDMTPVSGIFYPYSGFHWMPKTPRKVSWLAGATDTLPYVLYPETCYVRIGFITVSV